MGQRSLARIYYYNILQEPSLRPEGARDQQEFLETLRRTPYMEIRLGKTKLLQGVPVEKGIDIMLATDLLHFAANGLYDTAILVSGDGDFAYAVQAVKNLGRHLEVAYFENHTSRDLLEAADFSHLLDRAFLSSLWGGKGKGGVVRRRRSGRGQQQRQPSEGQAAPSGQQPLSQPGAQPGAGLV